MTEDTIDVRMPDGTLIRGVPKSITQAELSRRYGLTQNAPTEAAPPPAPSAEEQAKSAAQHVYGAAPAELLQRVKGAGRSVGKTGMEAIQYLQYLTGQKVSPTPLSLEPSPDPNQQIGEMIGNAGVTAAGTELAGAGAAIPARALVSQLPSATRAAGTLETILNAARKVPLDTTEMAQTAGKVETATRFGNLPPVIKKFILAHTNSEPIDFEAGRNLIKNVADAAQSLKIAGKDNISRLVNEFGAAVKTANRGAAEKVGMGELYDQAINEYRRAKTIEEAAATLKKYGAKAAISALLGSAATAGGYEVYKALR